MNKKLIRLYKNISIYHNNSKKMKADKTNVLKKIKLSHTFDDIIGIIKPSNKSKEIIEYYRNKLRPYLGPHPNKNSKYTSGFGFYIVTSGHDNDGKQIKEFEGYPYLPYEIDEIFQDDRKKLDWYDFGLSEYFLDKVTLDISNGKIKSDLNLFITKTVKEYESYGLVLLDNYKIKLNETKEFILKRISEYRNIIVEFIDKLS